MPNTPFVPTKNPGVARNFQEEEGKGEEITFYDSVTVSIYSYSRVLTRALSPFLFSHRATDTDTATTTRARLCSWLLEAVPLLTSRRRV